MRALWRVPLAFAAGAVLAGCASSVRIADLQYNPGRYYDRTVAVHGVVTSSWGVPLVPFKMYRVSDGTGEVTVLSEHGRTPARGAHVRVTGRVSDVAVIGGRPVGMHINEDDVHFERR